MSEAKPFVSSASPPPQKPPSTFKDSAEGLWGSILRPRAGSIIAALIVGGIGATGTYAFAQQRLDAGLEPIRAELAEVKKEAQEAKKQSANAERIALETNLNVRLIVEKLNMKPITLEPTKDGGQ